MGDLPDTGFQPDVPRSSMLANETGTQAWPFCWPSLSPRSFSSCNLTCPPGLHGVDCAQTCSCHEDSCDPVTGACRLGEKNALGIWYLGRVGTGYPPSSPLYPLVQRLISARA